MRLDRQVAIGKSALMPSLALIAVIGMAGGDLFAASDTPRHRPKPRAQPQAQQPAAQPAATPAPQERALETQPAEKPVIVAPERPAAVVVDNREVSGVLGREVRSAADENMGRVVDVIVDQSGQVRAAIIDFGGFLGVGSRKIAVDWKALRFSPAQERNRVLLEMTREQVRAAPEYQEGKPIFVLSAAAGSEPVRLTTGSSGR
jgi:hypothetical protein